MKSISALFFVLLYMLAMARPVLPLFEYIIEKDYIAEFLCINKENTELNCNGKCYLMQKIIEQNEERKQNLPRIAMEEYPIGFVTFVSFPFPAERITEKIVPQNYSNSSIFFLAIEVTDRL
ncbi:hypothetical protein [Pareuzebyella sediminis]|uniref:hypothetical protein n=1 Tax=Pareuzebyella sediminis TaxID=2607998 RepID=UPI0011EFCE30|nr:hypothetical protein [Pareuzebyella sediminis]